MSFPKKKFQPTPEMVAAADAVFMLMAQVSYVRPIVRAYQTRILQEGQWEVDLEYLDMGTPQHVILDPDETFLMKNDEFEIYDQRCHSAMRSVGLTVSNPGGCPLLEAQHLLMQAEASLIDSLEEVTGLSNMALFNLGMDNRKKYIELSLQLLAPFANPHQRFGLKQPAEKSAG